MAEQVVYVCPGPADGMEFCSFWMTGPGYCIHHPHIDLVARPLSATTVPVDTNGDPYIGVPGQELPDPEEERTGG